MSTKSILGMTIVLAMCCSSCFSDCGNEVTSCREGLLLCDGDCFDPDTSKDHCGRCFNSCDQHLHCIDGECRCFEGYVDCGNDCVVLDSDNDNCGACGFECPDPRHACCYGECVDLACNPEHCGSCSTVCDRGYCRLGLCISQYTDCREPYFTTCVTEAGCAVYADTKNSEAHCGDCNSPCGVAESCIDSVCTPEPCEDFGLAQCLEDGKQVCVDLQVDDRHCGACNSDCQGLEHCVAGSCKSCATVGLVECAGKCVNTVVDPDHCGECDNACLSTMKCWVGGCVDLDCQQDLGMTLCEEGGVPVCVNLDYDPHHCGDCDAVCGDDEDCHEGDCDTYDCEQMGILVCCEGTDNDPGPVCVDQYQDENHCGGCTTVCMDGEECLGGICR